MKQVAKFDLSNCPKCGGKMYLLESKYDAYALDSNSGRFVTSKVKTDCLSEFVCYDCGYHVEAEHTIYGVLPKNSHKLLEHNRELEKGKGLAKEIGYIDE